MLKLSLRSGLLLVACLCVVFAFAYRVLHFDDPFARIVLVVDPETQLTQDIALELTSKALREAGLVPVEPVPAFGQEEDDERFLGRNAIKPNDQVSIIWEVSGGSYRSYTVRLQRTPTHFMAEISAGWL